jgi:GAF domain-containing protein
MLPDLIQSLSNPLVIVIAVVVLVAIIVILILLSRSSKRKRQQGKRFRSDYMPMERAAQFSAGAERADYHKDPQVVLREMVALFNEHLSMPVLAVYAGREDDAQLENLLAQSGASGERERGEQWVMMPDSIPSARAREYWRPQVVALRAFTQPRGADPSPARQPSAAALSEPAPDEGRTTGEMPESGEQSQGIPTNPLSPPDDGVSLAVLSWRGPFGWSGLVATQANDKVDADALARYRDSLAHLSDRLGVALELDRERADVERSSEYASRSIAFFRSLITSLDEPSPLASIAREVVTLLRADSGALWRVEPGTGMVNMVAAHGLRSAEFLPLPAGQGLAGSVVQSGQTLALEDAPADPRCLFPREARESGVGSYLGVPVSSGEQVIGVVEAHTAQPRSWQPSEIAALESVAVVLADIFKSADARGVRLKVESAYLGLSEALQRLESREEVMEAAVEILGHALGVSRALLIDLDEEGRLRPVGQEYHAPGVKSALGAQFPQEVAERMLSETADGQAAVIADSRERSLIGAEAARLLQVLSEMAVPIRHEGRTRGIIYLHQCDRARDWQPDEVEFADRVARQLSLSIANVSSLDTAKRVAAAAREEARRASDTSARIQSFVNALPESAIGLDKQGKITFFNPAAREMLGLGNDSIGRMAAMIDSLTMSDESIWNRVISCQATTRFEGQLTNLPVGPRATPGKLKAVEAAEAAAPVPVSLAASPLRTNTGEITGYLVVLSDISHVSKMRSDADPRVYRLQQQILEFERKLSEANAELAQARSAEARARAEMEPLRRASEELKNQRDQMREDEAQVRRSAQQLLEINRLKSEFIVNAGRELESSLHSILGFAEQLKQGAYGLLTSEQLQAVHAIFGWARRMKEDISSLIDYGSTRSRRLESSSEE